MTKLSLADANDSEELRRLADKVKEQEEHIAELERRVETETAARRHAETRLNDLQGLQALVTTLVETQLPEKDLQIRSLQEQLREKDRQIEEKDRQIEEKDRMFSVLQSQLSVSQGHITDLIDTLNTEAKRLNGSVSSLGFVEKRLKLLGRGQRRDPYAPKTKLLITRGDHDGRTELTLSREEERPLDSEVVGEFFVGREEALKSISHATRIIEACARMFAARHNHGLGVVRCIGQAVEATAYEQLCVAMRELTTEALGASNSSLNAIKLSMENSIGDLKDAVVRNAIVTPAPTPDVNAATSKRPRVSPAENAAAVVEPEAEPVARRLF